MVPLWSFGYQQSHRTLGSPEEILREAKMFREKKLPCDMMIYLGTDFCPNGWNTHNGEFTWNPAAFPDPKRAIQELHDEHFKLVSLSQHSETGKRPHASVVMKVGGRQLTSESDGNGPVDASLKAIELEVKSGSELLLYSVNAITTGTESQGEVTVRLGRGGRIVNGVGADPDIVAASAKAYLSALNKLYTTAERLNPQMGI